MGELVQPQEFEVFYILPAIRRELALAMKRAQIPQKLIAERLCVRESTVSNYFHNKRGALKLPTSINWDDAAGKINTREDLVRETQLILNLVRNINFECELHKAFSNLPDNCAACAWQSSEVKLI